MESVEGGKQKAQEKKGFPVGGQGRIVTVCDSKNL